jgi:TetR/AcrR family transcriptional repressor of bet genes
MAEPIGTAQPQRKRRRTEPRDVRRTQLIDATITSIARHGIAGTTLSTVTEAAGLSIGIVNFHFVSKQKLLEETLLHLAREHHRHWRKAYDDAGLSAAGKLLAIVDAHFHPRICTRRKLAVWFAFYGEGGRRAVYRRLVDAIDTERYDLATGLCRQIAAEGGYEGPPPEQVAWTLEGLYDGMCLNILMYPGDLSRETAKAQIRAYLASVYPRHFALPEFPAPLPRARKGD